MNPIVMARHVRDGLIDYAETTFPMTNEPFRGSIRWSMEQGTGFFQHPYVSMKLPFRSAGESEDFPFSECLHPKYRPYAHQMRAFKRIAEGRSTLVATGTGSGKTECFLYPILHYCYKHRGEPGIKAIILYPMNALASDQAKRLAREIHDSSQLHGNVTAGIYIGERNISDIWKGMDAEHIPNDHATLLKNPPDILLTNYKMLDLMLVRPKDSQIWRNNKPDTLRYIVVDELHTFDGAQGTDLACLLRRLTDYLHAPADGVCCIGTSATMGSEDEADKVRAYAGTIFHTSFDTESVITEDRQQATEFFDSGELSFQIPTIEQVERLHAGEADTEPAEYLRTAAQAWLEYADGRIDVDSDRFRVELGVRLQRLRFLRSLTVELDNQARQIDEDLLDALANNEPRFAQLKNTPGFDGRAVAVDALIALVAHARIRRPNGSHGPFLDVQVQLWAKELRRIVAPVVDRNETIRYESSEQLDRGRVRHYLPIVNCRDCGGTGWIGLTNESQSVYANDLLAFYNAYFSYRGTQDIVIMDPCGLDYHYNSGDDKAFPEWFCPNCMKRQSGIVAFETAERECPACGAQRIAMRVRPLEVNQAGRKHYDCPFCGSTTGLALVGMRATSEISVALTQLSADRFNDDHKAIVFSDSVQDASYRAGFFNSRTWRFALRTSLMDCFQKRRLEGRSMDEFLNQLGQYLQQERQQDEDACILRFTAPNMMWMEEYERAANHQPAGPLRERMLDFIRRRVRLEGIMEFGLRSRVGRTLEKSGCLTVGFGTAVLQSLAWNVQERARNELGMQHGDIADDDWIRLIAAFLDQLKRDGAYMDGLYEESYIPSGGVGYLLTNAKHKWMPSDQNPVFLISRQAVGKSDFLTIDKPRYRMVVERYLSNRSLIAQNMPEQLLDIIRDEGVRSGVIQENTYSSRTGTFSVYGLDERLCTVTGQVRQLRCERCGREYSCAASDIIAWRQARCANRDCGGRLAEAGEDRTRNYYGNLYRMQPSPRIRAAEHTGLLSGERRSQVERTFKLPESQRRPGDINVLACTPTLEMGIDIGDLSTVILSSIPPTQAQYLQRVGRAGRRDGNSFILTIANAKSHDLYYYQRPDDMLNGNVDPPHIFMDAAAVLERQLTAYALEHWISDEMRAGRPADAILHRELKYALDNVRQSPQQGFPGEFFEYVKNHATTLFDGFSTLFEFNDAATRDHLEAFILGGGDHDSLTTHMLGCFQNTIDDCENLNRQLDDLQTMLKDLESKPFADISLDERKKECKAEIDNVKRMLRSINATDIFNYLSNEGILPNYAFPETGVTLHTILKRRKTEDESERDANTRNTRPRAISSEVEDYERPSSSAISELAPGNTFYAGGHKYVINRVVLPHGGNTAQEEWRLCPNCSHAEPASQTKNVASCPSCGSPQWADVGQKRHMLRISTVVSEQDFADGNIDDSGEGRQSTFFVKNTLVDINQQDVQAAYQLHTSTDFGFEYVPHGTIREINFGKADTQGPELEVDGDTRIRKGFDICMGCGALYFDNDKHTRHAYNCPVRRSPMDNPDKRRCLFLYRQVESEALRLLVPGISSPSGTSGLVESFAAAVMLGMRERFGNVDHLNVTLSSEPAPGTGLRKTYLVIYDTVPGGTGYLKQLAQSPDALVDVLDAAYQVMKDCDCAGHGQHDNDGCYHCLYAYRQSRDLERVSKRTAMGLMEPIIANRDAFERVQSVSQIDVNRLLDSQLEEQFIEALGRLREHPVLDEKEQGRRATVAKEVVRNKPGWVFTIGPCTWEIEPQVELGEADGLPIACKPDFVLRRVDAAAAGNGDEGGTRPVAVFTDGLQYHAAKVWDDTRKREALRCAGYRVWTLTYDDVFGFVDGNKAEELVDPMLDVNRLPNRDTYRKKVSDDKVDYLDPGKTSTMAMLGEYLSNPDAERVFRVQTEALAGALFRGKTRLRGDDAERMRDIERSVSGESQEYDRSACLNPCGEPWVTLFAGANFDMESRQVDFSSRLLFDDMRFRIPPQAVGDGDDGTLLEGLDTDDRESFKRQWSGFWHWVNVMQHADGFLFATTYGMAVDCYQPLVQERERRRELAAMRRRYPEGWELVFDDSTYACLEDGERAIIEDFAAHGLPAPSCFGYELEAHHEVVSEATLAWEDRRVAFISRDAPLFDEDVAAFERQGWTVVTACDDETVDLLTAAGEHPQSGGKE